MIGEMTHLPFDPSSLTPLVHCTLALEVPRGEVRDVVPHWDGGTESSVLCIHCIHHHNTHVCMYEYVILYTIQRATCDMVVFVHVRTYSTNVTRGDQKQYAKRVKCRYKNWIVSEGLSLVSF